MRCIYRPPSLCKFSPDLLIHLPILITDFCSLLVFFSLSRTAGMYMQEVLEAVCKKRKLDPNEYALLVRDMSVLILLDRTVASLEGKSDLVLVKRSMLPRYGIVDTGKSMRTTDPNGGSPPFFEVPLFFFAKG